MIDWSQCPAVVKRSGYLSGAPALKDDPRIPPETIVDNMDGGETAEAVIQNFGLRTPLQDVLAIYRYAQEQRARHS